MPVRSKSQCGLEIKRTSPLGRKTPMNLIFTSLINRVEAENKVGEEAGAMFRTAISLQDRFAGLNNNSIIETQKLLDFGDDAKRSVRELTDIDVKFQPYKDVPEAIFTKAALLANQLNKTPVDVLEKSLSNKGSRAWLRQIDLIWKNVEANLKGTGFERVNKKYPQVFTQETRLVLAERRELSTDDAKAMLKQDPKKIKKHELQIYFTLVDALSKINNVEKIKIDRAFAAASQTDVFIGGEIKVIPPLLKVGTDIMPILEQHPMDILDAANNGLGKQIALAKVLYDKFGKEGHKGLRQLRSQYVTEGGKPKDFDNMLKSFVGQPLAHPYWNPRSKTRRVLEHIIQPVGSGAMLSLSGVVQIPQTMINSFKYGGRFGTNYLRALLRAGNMLLRSATGANEGTVQEHVQYLRSLNAITSGVFNRWLIPGSKIEDTGKIIKGTVSRATGIKFAIQFNDFVSGIGAEIFNESIAGRKNLTEKEVQTLQFLEFSAKEIENFKQNPLTGRKDSRWGEIIRRFRKRTQFVGLRGPEKTRFTVSPAATQVFQFNQYLVGQTQSLISHGRVMQNAWKRSKASGNYKPSMVAMSGLMAYFVGNAVAGDLAILLRSFFKGKPTDRENEDLFERIWRDLGESLFLGPLHRAWDALRYADTIYAVPYYFVPASSYVIDLYNIGAAEGPYADLSVVERWQKYIEMHTPVVKTGKVVASMLGLYQTDPKLKEAVSRSYKWRRENEFLDADTRTIVSGYDETRSHIKKAIKLMQRGVDPQDAINRAVFSKYNEMLEEAGKGKLEFSKVNLKEAKRRVALSLTNKRPFKGVPDFELPNMANEIGADYYSALYAYDSLLELYINYLK